MKLLSRSHLYSAVLAGCVLAVSGCASKDAERKSDGGDSAPEREVESKPEAPAQDELELSNALRTVPISNSNNPLTPGAVNRSKAEEAAQKLEAAIKNDGGKDRANIIGLMAAQRLAGMGLNQVMSTARKLMELEVKANVDRDLPEIAKLEIVLTAIRGNNYSMAEYYLGDLVKSKNARIRAAALTAVGIIAQSDDRMPEAVASWQEALKISADYAPAAMNLGYAALRAGDVRTAKQVLGGMQENWFAVSGLIVAERLSGDSGKTSQLCDRILDQRPKYKPALFNCALHEYQVAKNHDKAKSLLDRMLKVSGGKAEYEEKAHKLISKIDAEKAQKASAAPDKKETAP